ncbi:RloB domain-containing protein [Salinivibrio sp. KP-1]|uniref:RloB domain-containing protein n=1 Tax=Salinivibrio sp. KP-1 TaxID=1406902 RepID=UPI00061463B7|nr:RloB domain-containing protein [Salinivibrio sp. KP-1]KKA43467.1 hypothetical protein WN56_13890 [Salinivibrio sp. KP-1]
MSKPKRRAGRKSRRVSVTSLLIVGEGVHDRAFLNHMKGLYDDRHNGQTIKVESSDGGSPGNIIRAACKQKEAAYDRRFVLMDGDVEITEKDWSSAKKHGIEIIISNPVCLEGMLLSVLGERAGVDGSQCKAKLKPYLGGPPTNKASYEKSFPKPVLDETDKEEIVKLRALMSNSTQ